MKQYESYRHTIVPWLDNIPYHWNECRAKYLYKKENRPALESDEVVTCFRDGQVTLRKNRRISGFTESIKEFGYQHIQQGDLVIHVMDAFAGAVGVSDSDGKGTPVYSVCTAIQDTNNYYFAYAIREMAKKGFIQSLYRGIRERSSDFRFDVFAAQILPVPPREEQDQIVHYLDWQTSKINQLITAKKQQIQVLKERQQKLICEVITKGIHSDIDHKDSHIVWIGEIPRHWSAIRCKYLFRERDERSKEGAETHLSMSQKYGLVPDSQLEEHRMLSESYAGGKLCYQDDLVLNRLKAHLGVFALAPQFGVISPDYTVLIPNTERIIPSFGEMVLKSALCRRELRVRVRGIIEGFWRLYTDDFYTIYLPVPPIEEQKEIMQYIDAQSKKTAALENALNKEIELLHELRTRLISDVVTGQIDIRNVEVPDFELVEEAADEAEEAEDEMEVE